MYAKLGANLITTSFVKNLQTKWPRFEPPCTYTVSQKKACDYIFCNNWNNECTIIIIFGTLINETICHRMVVSFPTSCTFMYMYMKFLPNMVEEILMQNIWTTYGSWLNILSWSWCNADIIMCHRYKLASLNWCCQLLPCFDGELNLLR